MLIKDTPECKLLFKFTKKTENQYSNGAYGKDYSYICKICDKYIIGSPEIWFDMDAIKENREDRLILEYSIKSWADQEWLNGYVKHMLEHPFELSILYKGRVPKWLGK